jgi:uncharacterized protein
MLSDRLPLFPLPNAVLFPDAFLPLHVFEPRYRQLVADVIAGERLIGITLLKPGWEPEYERRPAIFPVGCAGLVTHAERLKDGRYDIVLRGLQRFRVVGEEDERLYRVARVETLDERLPEEERLNLREARRLLERLLAPTLERSGLSAHVTGAMRDEELVNGLAQHLPLDPVERQALLERDGIVERSRALIELLQMRGMVAAATWSGGRPH